MRKVNSMREVTIAAIQMSCSRDVKENIEKAAKLIRAAAEAGAQIILPSELFERQYFCQERRYDYYDYAKPLSENDAVQSMKALAKELAPSGIQVNAVACGAIDTEMNGHLSDYDKAELAEEIPAGRFGTPQEVAELVKSLSGINNYLTGQIITLDGGWI